MENASIKPLKNNVLPPSPRGAIPDLTTCQDMLEEMTKDEFSIGHMQASEKIQTVNIVPFLANINVNADDWQAIKHLQFKTINGFETLLENRINDLMEELLRSNPDLRHAYVLSHKQQSCEQKA